MSNLPENKPDHKHVPEMKPEMKIVLKHKDGTRIELATDFGFDEAEKITPALARGWHFVSVVTKMAEVEEPIVGVEPTIKEPKVRKARAKREKPPIDPAMLVTVRAHFAENSKWTKRKLSDASGVDTDALANVLAQMIENHEIHLEGKTYVAASLAAQEPKAPTNGIPVLDLGGDSSDDDMDDETV